MSLRYWRSAIPSPAVDSRNDERRRRGRIRTPGIACSLGEVLDMSGTGLRFATGGKPGCAVGQRVRVTIAGPSGPFIVTVRPVWIRRTGMFRNEVGACFEDLDDASRARIVELVRRITSEPQERLNQG